MTDRQNIARRRRGRAALVAWIDANPGRGDPFASAAPAREEDVIDCITDVLHHARRWHLDPAAILRMVASHIDAEA